MSPTNPNSLYQTDPNSSPPSISIPPILHWKPLVLGEVVAMSRQRFAALDADFFSRNQVVSFYRNNYVQTIGHRVHCSNWFYYNWGFCGCILFNCLNDSFSLLHDSSTLSFILRVRKKCHARWYISPHPLLNHVQMIKAYKHPKPPQQQSPYDIHVSSCFYQAHFSHWRFFFTKMQDDCEAHRAQHGQLHCERAATPPGWVPPPPTWLWVKTLQDKDETGRRGFTTPRML